MIQINNRILIVEDEAKVASFIKSGLEEHGFSCSVACEGLSGRKMFDAEAFDLVIMDINLPYKNGIDLCKEIRQIDQKIPVIMLTALGTTEDKLLGFDSGADDYLLKPFEFRELLARIRALLKRTSNIEAGAEKLRIHDLELNLNTYEVKRAGMEIELTQKEFALLAFLLKNKGRIVSRAEIAENVWDVNFDTGTNTIDVYVNFLRKKIDKNFPEKLIHTHIGFGYILKNNQE